MKDVTHHAVTGCHKCGHQMIVTEVVEGWEELDLSSEIEKYVGYCDVCVDAAEKEARWEEEIYSDEDYQHESDARLQGGYYGKRKPEPKPIWTPGIKRNG